VIIENVIKGVVYQGVSRVRGSQLRKLKHPGTSKNVKLLSLVREQ
jgi:hypothetical protein